MIKTATVATPSTAVTLISLRVKVINHLIITTPQEGIKDPAVRLIF
jgi:hypothetical protein